MLNCDSNFSSYRPLLVVECSFVVAIDLAWLSSELALLSSAELALLVVLVGQFSCVANDLALLSSELPSELAFLVGLFSVMSK